MRNESKVAMSLRMVAAFVLLAVFAVAFLIYLATQVNWKWVFGNSYILILCLLLTGCTTVYVPVAKAPAKVPVNIIPPAASKSAQLKSLVSATGCTTYTNRGRVATWCPQPLKPRIVVWDCTSDSNNTFWVQSNINFPPGSPTNWPVTAIVKTNGYTFTPTDNQRFFAVRISNAPLHMLSGYALTTPSPKRIYQP
jgi:hypothetical protein